MGDHEISVRFECFCEQTSLKHGNMREK